ncbi:DUF6282 family protein [Thermodesulfobacteriota bacterium]
MTSAAMIERLMEGAIDFHVHTAPDPFHERRLDVLDLAYRSKESGMRAVVAKNHQFGTAPLANLVNKTVPGFTVIGSLTLNREAGGLNPDIVEAAARAGAKVIWMPTSSSIVASKEKPGIPLLDSDKRLLPDVITILEIIRENGMVLGTGHISLEEIYTLTAKAKELGVIVTITHPLTPGFGDKLTLQQQKELVSMGALIEHCFVACMPVLGGKSPKVMMEHINAVGEEHCILSTDFGQGIHPSPPEGFRMMVGTMLEFGLSEKEIETLIKINPASLTLVGVFLEIRSKSKEALLHECWRLGILLESICAQEDGYHR